MCGCSNHSKGEECIDTKTYRLADFFDANWDTYKTHTKDYISKEQHKAVSAMRACRTAVLGVDHYVCEECGESIEIYHNCRNRFCPTCSWGDTVKWAAKLKSQIMDVPHRHVVFTIPHALHPLVKRNGKALLNILLRTSADTFKDWVEHKYNLRIGVISVLHTFGETKDYHLHTHMIVSWGGIDNLTGKLTTIKGEFVKYKFLQNKFRCKFEDELKALYDKGDLKHDFPDKVAFLTYLNRINKTNWMIHLEPPMSDPSAVIRYIGRYSKRACLSERKITEIDGEYISFRHKDYKTIGEDNKPIEKILRLHYTEFFPRLLQHVPLPYFRLVRYYGLYSTKSKAIPEDFLNKDKETEEEQRQMEWVNPFVCTYCQKERTYQYTVFDLRSPKERTTLFNATIHEFYIRKRV
jgi:hypothetical protein